MTKPTSPTSSIQVSEAVERLQKWSSRFGPEVEFPVGVGPNPHDIRIVLAAMKAAEPLQQGDELKWHMPTMLRWLAENINAPRLPDGTLTGRFLYAVAENIETRAALVRSKPIDREKVARALAKDAGEHWFACDRYSKENERWLKAADAAITAIGSQSIEPEAARLKEYLSKPYDGGSDNHGS